MAEKTGRGVRLADFDYDYDEDRFQWVEVAIEGFEEWRIRAVVGRGELGLSLDGLLIEPTTQEPPPGGISADLLRRIRIGDLMRAARLASRTVRHDSGYDVGELARAGRRGHSDWHYAVWAARYVDALPDGRPIADLASRWHVSPESVRSYVHTARQKDLLTPAINGKAGGELTDKAKAILEGGDDGEHQTEA